MPVPRLEIRALISSLSRALSTRALSTFRIFPLMGRTAWNRLSRAPFAGPAAESPSTINSSVRVGSFSIQSESFPARPYDSTAPLRFTASAAFRAASRARCSITDFSTMRFAIAGVSSKNSLSDSWTMLLTRPSTSLLPSFVLVCPSNCGCNNLTAMTIVRPPRTSSPRKFGSFSLRKFIFRA